jgi:hypothetical protein
MAWSYRNDRSDEIYANTSGPAVAQTEKLPRPPADGEDTEVVLHPPEPKQKDKGDMEAPPEKPPVVVKPKEAKK